MREARDEWNAAYDKQQNFLFYPNEEVIRFVSRFFRQRNGLDSYVDKRAFEPAPRSLDLGCGIGRHVMYLDEVGFDSYGIDLSDSAVRFARQWASRRSLSPDRIVHGVSSILPWSDGFFDCIVSHGVLDSMRFEIAIETLSEMNRVLAIDGLIYCDLISGDDDRHWREYAEEEVVQGPHETGTIQSYFNAEKIQRLVGQTSLRVREAALVRRDRIDAPAISARYHLVLERN